MNNSEENWRTFEPPMVTPYQETEKWKHKIQLEYCKSCTWERFKEAMHIGSETNG
jgi:hypothetical protein